MEVDLISIQTDSVKLTFHSHHFAGQATEPGGKISFARSILNLFEFKSSLLKKETKSHN